MAAPRKERAHERYAWILLFVAGLLALTVSVFIIIVTAPVDTTGVTWEGIVSRSLAAAKLTSYFIGQFGTAEAGFSILTMGISVLGYRRGERWAWYVLWFVPIVWLGYVVTNLAVGGTFWIQASVVMVIALLGLLLPCRKFFPKKQPVGT